MGDHKSHTSLDDQKYGEEFWSAGEELCSCHSDEDVINEFCTCNDGDDDDYETDFCICNQFDSKRADKSGGYKKNAETQNELQDSIGSADKNIDIDESDLSNIPRAGQNQLPVRQHTSQNDVSNQEQEWNSKSTKSHVIKDGIESDTSKCLHEGDFMETTSRSRSFDNKTGEINGGVKTKRVGLVVGNRQLTSVVGSTVSSMTDYDAQSDCPNREKDSDTVQSMYQHMDCVKRADKTMGSLVPAQSASKQTEEPIGEGGNIHPLSHNHETRTKKAEIKGQEKSLNNAKENCTPEPSRTRDQSEANNFFGDEVPQHDPPRNNLSDGDEKRSKTIAPTSQNSNENVDDSNQCQIKDETEDLMILILSSVQEMSGSMVDLDRYKTDTSSANNDTPSLQRQTYDEKHKANSEGKKKLLDDGRRDHTHCLKCPHELSCDQSGCEFTLKEAALQNDVAPHYLIKGDEQRNQAQKKIYQNSERKSDEEAQSRSLQGQRFTPNADATGKDNLLDNELHICNHCMKHLHKFSCDHGDRSDGKSFLREELPQNGISTDFLDNGEAKRKQFIKPVKQEVKGKSDDSKKSWIPCQRNNDTDQQIQSPKLSVQLLSGLIAGAEKAEVDATYTSKESISIRVNAHCDTDAKENPRDNGKQNSLHCLKYHHEPSYERSEGKSSQRKDIPYKDLQTNQLRNGDEKQDQHFKNGTHNFEENETHALSHQIRTQDADIKERDKLPDYGKQDCVHCFRNINDSSCDQSGARRSHRKDVSQKDLLTSHLRKDDVKRSQLLNQTKRKSHGKLDDSDESYKLFQRDGETNDQIPLTESQVPELSHKMSAVGKAETNPTITSKSSPRGDEVHQASQENCYQATHKHDGGKRGKLLDDRNQDCSHCLKYPHDSPCYQSGSMQSLSTKEALQDDIQTKQSRNGDGKRSPSLARTNRNSERKLDDSDKSHEYDSCQRQDSAGDAIPSTSSSVQEPSGAIGGKDRDMMDATSTDNDSISIRVNESSCDQSGFKRFLRKAPQNDPPTNHMRKVGAKRSRHMKRTNHNSQGNLDDEDKTPSHQRRTRKADIQYPYGSLSAPQNDLPRNLRSDDEDSTPPLNHAHQNYQGTLNDTDKSRELHVCQLNDETDRATSIKCSTPDVSAMTSMDMAETDADYVTNPSISIGMEVSDTWSHKKHFYDMWMKGKFCDVNIVVDGQVFSVHRVVLAANSEYFETFFLNSPVRTNDTDVLSVYVAEMSADIFRIILRYMYTGRIDIQFSQVSQLLTGSLFLSIKSLTSALQDFLLKTWKGECIGAFCLAQTAGLHDLHKVILNYIRNHFVEISTSEHFALCPAEHVSAILSDDNLWINEEMDVLYAVLLWLEHHTRDISSNLRLLRHVRFEYIPLTTIDRIEKSHLNSVANESVKRYIHDARKRASCLGVDQLHFDPPISRQRMPEVVGCRTLRTNSSQSIESTNADRSFQASDKKKYVNPSKNRYTSAHSLNDVSISTGRNHSPSSSKSCHSVITKATPFPSYHEIDTNPIHVSVSQDVTTSPVISDDDLRESSCKDSADDESSVQLVRIGGISRTWKDDYVHNDIEKLENGPSKRWEEWTSCAELPVAMHHHAACYIHNSIYISGGHVQLPCDASSNNFQPSRLFHVYDLMKEKWYRLADLEQARVFHQMVALFGQLYVIGGQGHDGGALSAVERYSPYTDSWRHAAPLSFPRFATAAAAYNFHLWVAGGASNHMTSENADGQQQSNTEEGGTSVYDGFYKSTSTFLTAMVECYSPHNNSWTKINDLPTPRCHSSLIRINKHLFLVGGFCSIRHNPSDDRSTSSVDVLDDVSESWRYVTDIGEGNYSANTVVAGSKIVVLGKPGPFLESGGDVISIFDTSNNNWELRRSLLLEARVGHACCAIHVPTHSKLCKK